MDVNCQYIFSCPSRHFAFLHLYVISITGLDERRFFLSVCLSCCCYCCCCCCMDVNCQFIFCLFLSLSCLSTSPFTSLAPFAVVSVLSFFLSVCFIVVVVVVVVWN